MKTALLSITFTAVLGAAAATQCPAHQGKQGSAAQCPAGQAKAAPSCCAQQKAAAAKAPPAEVLAAARKLGRLCPVGKRVAPTLQTLAALYRLAGDGVAAGEAPAQLARKLAALHRRTLPIAAMLAGKAPKDCCAGAKGAQDCDGGACVDGGACEGKDSAACNEAAAAPGAAQAKAAPKIAPEAILARARKLAASWGMARKELAALPKERRAEIEAAGATLAKALPLDQHVAAVLRAERKLLADFFAQAKAACADKAKDGAAMAGGDCVDCGGCENMKMSPRVAALKAAFALLGATPFARPKGAQKTAAASSCCSEEKAAGGADGSN